MDALNLITDLARIRDFGQRRDPIGRMQKNRNEMIFAIMPLEGDSDENSERGVAERKIFLPGWRHLKKTI